MQPWFRKFSFFNYLALALTILAAHSWFAAIPNRSDRSVAAASLRYVPVSLDPAGFAPLKLAGAWRVKVGDDRFGGVSALALDRGRLMALTDSGAIVSLPRPGLPGKAILRDLPGGPGSPAFKRNRDSEALASDPRGWWVAFENADQLWLYDPGFRRPLARIDPGDRRWRTNQGVEAMVRAGGGLLLFPENGEQELALGSGSLESRPLRNRFGRLSDAVTLADGRTLLVGRELGLGGFENRLLMLGFDGRGMAVTPFAPLGMRRLDNVEAIAAEPRSDGGTRLWLMTDNDFRPRKATLLVALDLP